MGQYRDLEKRRAYMREYQRRKYAEDPAHREKAKKAAAERMKKKYNSDPEFRQKVLDAAKRRQLEKSGDIAAYQKEYRKANRASLSQKNNEYKRKRYATDAEYREQYKQREREWNKTEQGISYRRRRNRQNREDPLFRIVGNLRSRIRSGLVGHSFSPRTQELIGCTLEELKAHLEKQFKDGMTWDNYEYYGWHVDHIMPVKMFDLRIMEERKKCFHYTNLRPLWREQNQSKGARVEEPGATPRFPVKTPSDEEADYSHECLKKLDAMLLWRRGNWWTRSDVPGQLDLFIAQNRDGLRASDRFHWAARMNCASIDGPSPMENWYTEEFRDKLESSPTYQDLPRATFEMRQRVVSQFRPSAAKAVYQAFGATSVYDPCGGWGDRMEGALATDSVTRYHCRDVSPLVFSGYTGQIDRYDLTNKIVAENKPAQNDGLPTGYFDLVFTSPPYFKTERYHGEEQSFRQFDSFEQWMDKFLFTMCERAWAALKPDGHMAINITDYRTGQNAQKICVPLSKWAAEFLPDCRFIGSVGYRISRRMFDPTGNPGVLCEPILIFSKGPSDWLERMNARFPAPVVP